MAPKGQDVFVVSDEALFASALASLLSADASLNVVVLAAHGDGRADAGIARLCTGRSVPVVIYDLASSSALSSLAGLARVAPLPHVVVVLSADSFEDVPQLIEAGARGIVARDADPDELVRAIAEVAAGHMFASRLMLERMLEHVARSTHHAAARRGWEERLAPRERQVVRLLTRGMTNREIATSLHLSEATVKAHLGRVMAKWNARDRVQVVLRVLGPSSGRVQ